MLLKHYLPDNYRRITVIILVVLLTTTVAVSVSASTLCGTLTDSNTSQPVAGAGVFARLPNGQYAGSLAVSDASGSWCISDLMPGFYTLEIRVNDYLTIYRNDVEVTDDVSSIPVVIPRAQMQLDPPWPNPATSLVKMRLTMNQSAGVDLGIYDLRGRLVQNWHTDSLEPGTREYQWDGLDHRGRPSPSGIYLIRARTTASQVIRRFVLSR